MSIRNSLIPGAYWRNKDQDQYVCQIIGIAIEGGGGVSGAIVMYKMNCNSSNSWTTEQYFLENFEPDPFLGCRYEFPVTDGWVLD
jgi:hypothetical protein